MITITTRTDLVNYVNDVRYDLSAHGLTEAVVDALQAADHPRWGSDWAEWLDATLTDELVESVVELDARRRVEVRTAAIGGLPLEIEDVAIVDAKRGVITARDTYADDDDGRLLDAVAKCLRAEAERLVAKTRRDVEVYAAEGHLWMTVEVSR